MGTQHLTFKTMQHATLTLALIFSLVLLKARCLFIPENQAKSLISNPRSKRANGFLEEVRRPSNAERECAREDCVFEEYIEAKENVFKGTMTDLRGMVSLNSNNYDFRVKAYFDQLYTNCVKFNTEVSMSKSKEQKTVIRRSCLGNMDLQLTEQVFAQKKTKKSADS